MIERSTYPAKSPKSKLTWGNVFRHLFRRAWVVEVIEQPVWCGVVKQGGRYSKTYLSPDRYTFTGAVWHLCLVWLFYARPARINYFPKRRRVWKD